MPKKSSRKIFYRPSRIFIYIMEDDRTRSYKPNFIRKTIIINNSPELKIKKVTMEYGDS